MSLHELSFASGEASLSVRSFAVREALSSVFTVSISARSESPAIDLEAIVGHPASFRLTTGVKLARGLEGKGLPGLRVWSGICAHAEQVEVEPTGLSTYELRIVPSLWLLTQRRGHRIFQHLSIPDIVAALLREWEIDPVFRIDRARYPKLEYRAQYGESDYAFVNRLLEEAGIAYFFDEDERKGSVLTFDDALHGRDPRPGLPIRFVDNPSRAIENEHVTKVRLAHQVRPGAYRVRDYDFRNPAFDLFAESKVAEGPEKPLEQYHYGPGAFLMETVKPGAASDTPVADVQGVARYEQSEGRVLAEVGLLAERRDRRTVAFATNVPDLRPGTVFSMDQHPHPELADTRRLLMTELSIVGSPTEEWKIEGAAVFTDIPHRPPRRTPKPEATGVQSATVVGPPGQEIHTDEFGRVRVQFPWDREGKHDDHSSCWLRVSQGWAGTGFGLLALPRIGQEVLVGFLAADPDQPIVVGRVFNNPRRVPYKLPEHKTRSTWKSDSSPGSNGFNEIMFEDLAGQELVFEQAQKNHRRLVKHDEVITVVNDRQKLVKANEIETTDLDRTEVTGVNRTEITGHDRIISIGGNRDHLVKGREREQTLGSAERHVGHDQDVVIHGVLRESVGAVHHVTVGSDALASVGGSSSLTVAGSRHDQVGQDLGLDVGGHVHVKAGATLVLEVGSDFTIKAPGGFLRINAEGVTIKGSVVKINSGGAPGPGAGVKPRLPDPAKPAELAEPPRPEMDDVSRTGINQ